MKKQAACLIFALLLSFLSPALADSDFVTVKISNTSDVIFDDNDVFHISCTDDAGESADLYLSITSFYYSDTYAIEEGSYRVSGIEYIGNNWEVYDAGFGVCDYFSTRNAGDDIIQIAVGEAAIEALQADSSYSIVSYDDSLSSSRESEEAQGEQEPEKQTELSSVSDDETVVYYEQEESGLSILEERLIRVGANLLICAFLCGAGLLIFRRLHNRGYF